jgi:ABC-type arginine/histidine transport system permease subunit
MCVWGGGGGGAQGSDAMLLIIITLQWHTVTIIVIFFVHVCIKQFYKCSSNTEKVTLFANEYITVFRGRFFLTMFLFIPTCSNFNKTLNRNQYGRAFKVHTLISIQLQDPSFSEENYEYLSVAP